jgi:general secretion pathway protein D
LRIVSELIDKLDGRPQQVMISTVFGDMAAGNTKELGVQWGAVSNVDADGNGSSKLGAGSVNVNTANPLGSLLTLGTTAALSAAGSGGLNLYGQIDNVTAAIRALESNSDFKVLSRPTVYTSNNRKAVISSGQRVAVPTNTFSSGGNVGGATQSTNIEYRDVLLRFEVVPLINSDDEVTLRISLLNEAIQGEQVIDGNAIPTIVTESISTTVTIPNNATVVLGGLVTERYTETTSGVPVLSHIPLVGRLFRTDSKVAERRELLIFMQPQIITGESSRRAAAADTESRYKVTPALRDFADGVLPGKAGSHTAAPTKKSSSKGGIPTASKRPSLRYPSRR